MHSIDDEFEEDERWTKEELRLAPGPVQLAIAVIRQWNLDGRPKCDLEAIGYWKGIIIDYIKKQDKKLEGQVNLAALNKYKRMMYGDKL